MIVKALVSPASELGEGILLDEANLRLFWVDINKNKIFHYDLKEEKLEKAFDIKGNPSCIFSVSGNILIYVDNIGINKLELDSGKSTLLDGSEIEHCSYKFRSNDGVMLNSGEFVFGTMSYQPEKCPGIIYKHNIVFDKLTSYSLGINIPNTFIQDGSTLYISDSFKKCTYELNLDILTGFEERDKDDLKVWRDFSESEFTPDGGCISNNGYLHIALWGGAAIGVFDRNGDLKQLIELPVLQPTNCAFHGNRWLYVTSAYEGMSPEQLGIYPLSGSTLVVDLGEDYEY